MADEPGAGARPLRVAAYGYVRRDGGSVASANDAVLDRLLALGHRVEFHAIGGFVVPEGLIGRENFAYVPTSLGPVRAGWRLLERGLPAGLRALPAVGYSQVSNALHERAIARRLARRHASAPFDALLALGMLAPFRVPGLPCVSWPQGPPQTEWEAIRSLRGSVRRYGGRALYGGLALLYRHKQRVSRSQLPHSDLILCGSRWAVDAWERFGVPRRAVRAVPYPYDLDAFRPGPRAEERPGVTRFLWLGRVVPRKRLDLLLDAFRRLRADRPDVELWVVGRFAYARGYRRLLDEYADVPGITYRPSVPRADLPALFRRVDAVVQPSENENLGSSVLEGLCCGIPAVVGPTNGSGDYLGPSAVVFDAYTPESLHRALALMADRLRADRPRLAAEARASAERFLSVDTVVAQLCAAVRDAAHAATPPGGAY